MTRIKNGERAIFPLLMMHGFMILLILLFIPLIVIQVGILNGIGMKNVNLRNIIKINFTNGTQIQMLNLMVKTIIIQILGIKQENYL